MKPILSWISCLAWITCALQIHAQDPKPLPSPSSFDPERYLGKWFELARLPAAYQPTGSLATAEYALGEDGKSLTVKNTAYDADGKLMRVFKGDASMEKTGPLGRLRVRFGGPKPTEPNYCIMKLDPDYRYAVVGSPQRQSLWILARDLPFDYHKLEALVRFAKDSGFDTSKLEVAKWPDSFATKDSKSAINRRWTFEIEGPDGNLVKFPMELEVHDGTKLQGRMGRGQGAWLKLEDGKVQEDTIQFTVKRDRPNGGWMTYNISGTLRDGQLKGEVIADMDGREITSTWEASRASEE